ncbi:unnamed protein product [Medioppia subpectinata]|uniref:Sulfotransferase domain-containing protein n=1 Tax=Medioppia subpectinata TaxID=1979941 RepID=A0A7R9Q0Z8_9ACAR|nr:unnamed protein product [Medioppia subpectinata]CAG2108531.1 unnamed protein product [Medioppia subpectinata]
MFKISDKFHKIRGNYYNKRFMADAVEYALDYAPRSRDRIMVYYAKSDPRQWIESIASQLVTTGRRLEAYNEPVLGNYLLEHHGEALFKQHANLALPALSDVTFMRSHLPFKLFPYRPEPRYLFVLRNPKDVCVSLYYSFNTIYDMEIDFDTYFKFWVSGTSELPFGDYFESVLDYWSHRGDSNCTLIIYEHMLTDPTRVVRQIASFLGPKYVARLTDREADNGEQLLERMVRESSFTPIKGSLNKWDSHFNETPGDWRLRLNRLQSDAIDARAARVWSGTGLLELWPREMQW